MGVKVRVRMGIKMSRIFSKKIISLVFVFVSVFSLCFASESGSYAFVEGCQAYAQGDWENARYLLKKAVSYPEYSNPDSYYMLISAEMSANDYKTALNDCNLYLKMFDNTIYDSRINYLKGKILFNLSEYDKAVLVLSDFCHQYEKDDMYSYALFYIAESLYADYKYDEAKAVYQRIVNEYPDSQKMTAAQYRIDSISQRGREEKLLYLLKQTGEEYLSAKEDYEKQLRLYNSDPVSSAKSKLTASQKKNTELEAQIKDLENEIAALKLVLQSKEEENSAIKKIEQDEAPELEPFEETKERIRALKEKALQAQDLLDKIQ